MLSNGNYAQYFPQGLTPQFFGGFGAGAPQFVGPQGLSGFPGLFGGHAGFGLDSGYQGFGQQFPLGSVGAGPQIAIQQITFALGQLAHYVATQGILAQQIGATLGQLAQYAQQIAQQGRSLPFANASGLPAQSPFIGFGNQTGFGNQLFGAAPAQSPFSPGTSGGYGGFTPQAQWGTNRPAMAS